MENLPSFLSMGKALLLLFVGEEEDDIGRRQNQALVEEMKGLVESGWRTMERYLASWIHLYVHQSAVMFNQYIGSVHRRPSCPSVQAVVILQLGCPSWGPTSALCPPSLLLSSPICRLEMKSIGTPRTPPSWLRPSSSGCRGLRTGVRHQQVTRRK